MGNNMTCSYVPVLCCEGRSTGQHVVHESPQGPPVHRLPVSGPGQYLRGHVLDGPAERVRHCALVYRLFTQPKICQFNMTLGV